MAASPITSQQIERRKVEVVTYFIFLGSKITADGYCCHEVKRHLLLKKKAMTNLDSILKSRDITLSTKVHIVKAMVFPIVIYGCGVRPQRRLSTEELMPSNCGAGEDSWEPLGLQGNQTIQPWIFIGRTDVEIEAPILWPPDVKIQFIGKVPDAW